MANLADALYARAQTQSGLYALIGGATRPRFYLGKAPQNVTGSYCVHGMLTEMRPEAGSVVSGIVRARVSIDSVAKNLTDARALDAQVVAAFHRFQGTSSSLVIQDIFSADTVVEFYDSTALLWTRSRDFLVWYEGTGT